MILMFNIQLSFAIDHVLCVDNIFNICTSLASSHILILICILLCMKPFDEPSPAVGLRQPQVQCLMTCSNPQFLCIILLLIN